MASRATAALTVVPDTYPPDCLRARSCASAGARTVNPGVVPVTVSWTAATDIGTGVVRYELRRRLDGGDWQDVALPAPTSRSIAQTLPTTRAVQYQVRATDAAGNAGAWRSSAAVHLRQASERSSAVRYARTWKTGVSAAYLGGALKRSRVPGATASYSFTGSQVAWIAARGPTRGSARVYVDGRYVATVKLYSRTVRTRRAVYTYSWATAGRHRITIRVSGTAGHPRVDVDGFAVVDSASAYPVLVGAGDIASCSYTGDSATASLLDRIPGTVFAAGDTVYESGSSAEFANCYAPTWGRFRSRTLPVPGNHEYGSAGAAPYFAYFGSRAGTPGAGLVRLRPRRLEDLWAELQLRIGRRLRAGIGPGGVAAGRPRRQPAHVRRCDLASPAVHVGRARLDGRDPSPVAGAVRRGRRAGDQRP